MLTYSILGEPGPDGEKGKQGLDGEQGRFQLMCLKLIIVES